MLGGAKRGGVQATAPVVAPTPAPPDLQSQRAAVNRLSNPSQRTLQNIPNSFPVITPRTTSSGAAATPSISISTSARSLNPAALASASAARVVGGGPSALLASSALGGGGGAAGAAAASTTLAAPSTRGVYSTVSSLSTRLGAVGMRPPAGQLPGVALRAGGVSSRAILSTMTRGATVASGGGTTTTTTTATSSSSSSSSSAASMGSGASSGSSSSSGGMGGGGRGVGSGSTSGSGGGGSGSGGGGGSIGGSSRSVGTSSSRQLATSTPSVAAPSAPSAPPPSSSSSASASSSSSAIGGGNPVLGQGLCPHGFVRNERFPFVLADFIISTTVGTGTFGRVCVAQHIESGKWYALKILKKSEIIAQRQLEHIKSEVKILSTVSHPFIVRMLGHIQNPLRLYMLFEYVAGGELFSHLRAVGVLKESAARFYACEIVLALEYLHGLGIIYRDLKPENLLLTAQGHIKITDFGFAKAVADRTYSLCGTPDYLAPEIVQQTGHNKAVDWWALGILIFEMLAGFPPFTADTQQGIYAKITAGDITWPREFSRDAKDLIKRLLTPDRSRRLGSSRGGASDVKEHPWFGMGSGAGGGGSHFQNWDKVYRLELTPPYIPRVKGASDTSNFDKYPDSDGETARELSLSENSFFAELDAL